MTAEAIVVECSATTAKRRGLAARVPSISWLRGAPTTVGRVTATIKVGVLGARGPSADFCDDCGEPIPERRRLALAGVRTCVACQSERDQTVRHSAINRRGSKDSQLR